MNNCNTCASFDKEFGCNKHPTEINDTICLLRHITITLNCIYQDLDDETDDGDSWKKNT